MSDLEPGVRLSPDAIAAMERLRTPPPRNTMSEQHEATPKEWANHEKAAGIDGYSSCLLELRGRVKALEATQHAHVDTSHLSKEERDQILQELAKPARVFAAEEVAPIMVPSPAGSLVERVQRSINDHPFGEEARAAILDVAEWLRMEGYASWDVLEQETNR